MKKIVFFLILVFFLLTGVFIFKQNGNSKNKDLTKITLRLQWHIQTQFAGYYVALDKGFYQKEGLKVKIKEGGYGKNNQITVKNGVEEFGTKWMADLIASKEDFISLANILKDNGLLLISKKEKNITKISDFKNKRISIWFIGNEFQLYSLLDKYNLPLDSVEIISQKWDMSQFLNDEVDVASAMSYNDLIKIYAEGLDSSNINVLSFKDLGVGFPGQNIFTSGKYYQENPEICRKFVKASLEGWRYAIDHPEEATDIVLKYDKDKILNKELQYKQMKEIIKLINIDKYQLGYLREEDYAFITKTFKKYKILDLDAKVENLYTNELIKGE